MIKLSFTFNNEPMFWKVEGKEIFYCDRVWKSWLRIIPRDEEFFEKVRKSRNKIPKHFLDKFELTEQDKKEYKACKNENELSEQILKDARSKGLILLKKEVE